ncbi:SDR family oxidoreductase [Sphingobacterium psychroaquaticum]|uniref:NAD(P)H dehydrogenase (Quinone) n=1 Tax=Sphingobacterium psychroaquaticum TaxID=561061 RepID=A0A1X7I2Q8_9SPHI|nr:SDR family oxidoreductase [Sphingobacterium psychroaquaticum]SMG08085.1 NAD(P)H dehydrogenase (quinone) [Sphingobacterium psychroaquaticum]
MKIGITGATGQLGRLVVEGLKGKVVATDLVALVRSPENATDLGIEARTFNYDQADLLTDALSGIDTLLLISGSEVGARTQQHGNVIRAAQSAGVTWIVYTSLLHADQSGLSLAAEHVETEALLKASGVPYTILRNGWYTENYTGSIANAIAGGAFVGSAGHGQIASAARADYAAAAVAVLTSAGHQGKTYELAGDTAYTLTDLAAEVSKQTGKDIPYMNLPEQEYANLLISFDVPAPLAEAIAGWDSGAAKGDLFDDGKTLSKLIGRPTTPLADVVRAAL